GFRHTTCALGTHLTPLQLQQLADRPDRSIYIVFDQDENHAGQQASHQLARRLADVGVSVRMIPLPPGHDPNSYLTAGATTADFMRCLQQAHPL
ncbi:MAG TPA: toprim domain-containing protein, partial [Steroidobacteraceae bacterium]